MEVKIGVAESPRELVVASDQSPEEVQGLVDEALASNGGTLALSDDKGRRYIIPAARIAYVEIGPGEGRRVGFGVGA
ncbi:hypothetical protein Acsp06_61610 [Actinomycetospora sp. NBRC 106375]|uniref:DUF3107 domain-containing protein n=1 Tax=Actinomycetospora sp. NBRC 106375 TaxID=3032207 RepID=UPI0024A375F4|nr:DUF3107 domain-containing protein [Actinomycetospora sp. NBRC 106375]GLZ49976.1 hypothetical protein Acsp06_61610 [Actinomycetospora sp. NBRC 106375]